MFENPIGAHRFPHDDRLGACAKSAEDAMQRMESNYPPLGSDVGAHSDPGSPDFNGDKL